jgi:hypothetical protein
MYGKTEDQALGRKEEDLYLLFPSPGVGAFEALICSAAIKYTPAHRDATTGQIRQRHCDVDSCVMRNDFSIGHQNSLDNAGLDKSTT